MMKNKLQIRIKNFILFGLMFVLLVSVAYSSKIFGFTELRFDGALLINSTTLSIKTNDIVRLFVNSDGNVGIGTVSPNATLDVNGTGPGNLFRVGNASDDFLVVNGTTGFVGIGITNPKEALEVSGNIRPTTSLASNLGTFLFDTTFDIDLTNPEADTSDAFGYSVSDAGDVNGDGFQDVIVACENCDGSGTTDSGSVFIYFGGPSMNGSANVTIHNPEPTGGDRFGFSVSSAGDVNGDGYSDVIVGCANCDSGGTNTGSAFIYFGGSSMDSTFDVNLTNPEPDSADFFGVSVSSAGDVNGDGFQDVIVGCRECDGVAGGVVFIYFGGSSMDNTADVTINNPEPTASDSFGTDVSSAGDVNGDGFQDVIVGCNACDGGLTDSGSVFIYFGGSSMDATADVSINNPEATASDNFGTAVSSAGDVNGDGFQDVIVGCQDCDGGGLDSGSAFIYFGGSSMDASADVLINNPEPNDDEFGISVSSAGDVNGDGYQDVIVGCQNCDDGLTDSGSVFIYYGGSSMDTTADVSINNPEATASDNFGFSVSSAGDVNGDGFRDVFIGCFNCDGGGSNSGSAFIYLGNGTRWQSVFAQNVNVNRGLQIGGLTLDRWGLETNTLFGITAPNWEIDSLGTASFQDLIVGDKVGIGTTDPAEKLVVIGNANISDSLNVTNIVHLTTLSFADGTTQTTTAATTNDSLWNQSGNDIFQKDITGNVGIGTITPATALDVNGKLNVTGNASIAQDTLFVDNTSSRVGIGTKSPSYPLDVLGNIHTTKQIRAQEVCDEVGANCKDIRNTRWSRVSGDGNVESSVKIADNTNGGPTLANDVSFGSGVSSIGDFNGDGVEDLVVGVDRDDTGGNNVGSVYILFMNGTGNGTGGVSSFVHIGDNINGGPTLTAEDTFGFDVSSIGDLNGDGVEDIVVGAPGDDTGSSNRGAVYILFMNTDGTVSSSVKIASDTNGGPTLVSSDKFGRSVTGIGDLNGDGVEDIAVGAIEDDTGGSDRGALHILFMNTTGGVSSFVKIGSDTGVPTLTLNDRFGKSVSSIGDLNGDGVEDLVVAADRDDTGGTDRGAVYILFMNTTGNTSSTVKIASDTNGGPTLLDGDSFGESVSGIGDLNGDGVRDIAVGAGRDDTGGTSRGALYILFMNIDGTVSSSVKIADNTNGGPNLSNSDIFGVSVAPIGDFNGDGVGDLAVGANGDETGGQDRGSVHILFMAKNNIHFVGQKVGIGTTAPLNTLHVNGSGAQGGFRVTNESGTDVFFVNSTLGRVGILLTTPTTALDVTGTVTATAFSGDGSSLTGISSPTPAWNSSGTSVYLNDTTASVGIGTISPSAKLDVNGTGPGNLFRVGNATNDFIVVNGTTGFVGIGTTNPQEALEVAGNIRPTTPLVSNLGTFLFDTSVDVTIDSPEGSLGDDFGGTISPAGDVNGDGIQDVIVSCRACDGGGSDSGSAFIYFGNSSMEGGADVTLNNPEPDGSDEFGQSVSSAGDVNGDGYDDVIVGCSSCDGGGSNSGSAYIYFGGSSMDATFDFNLSNPEPTTNDRFGTSVSSAGDVNGDGYSDVIVGCRECDGVAGGAAFIYFGGSSMDSTFDVNLSNPEPDSSDNFGFSVSDAGDVNGDGYDDVIVGCYICDGGGAGSGSAFIYFGGSSLNGTPSPNVTIDNPEPNTGDTFGFSVSSAGDVNGDGYDDVIVGCEACDSGLAGSGSAFIYFGGSSMDTTEDVTIDNPEPDSGDRFGTSVSSAGDVNGDGYSDVIVGCEACDGSGIAGSGSAYIYYGGSSMDSTEDVSIHNPEPDSGDDFGVSVSSPGDVNGDGYQDVIVGCQACDGSGTADSGSIFIYLGNGTRWQSVFAQNVNVNRGLQIGGLTLDRWALQTNTLFGITAPNWEIDSLGTASFQDLIVADNVGIGTTTPTHELHVVGDANITNNLYLGGNLTDLAENIFSAEDVEAGDVVVVADDMKVIKSYKAYDKRVVGVISTAPAATFGGNKGNVPLAISGRVLVKATDENGPIDPGDLLTTSSTLGHAMKCNYYEKCFGNTIGKAITPLDGKKGIVTMMIMLN